MTVVNDWDGKHIVTSPDVDGILSTLVVSLNTGATLAGIYTTQHYLSLDGSDMDDARNALWLDHDISQMGIRCIGQHLVNHSVDDRLPSRHPVSFNPNIFYGQAYPDSFRGWRGQTRDKYPFATVHLLMSALGINEPPKNSHGYYLLAHADGSWGTCQDYCDNTKIWYDLMFDANDKVLTDIVCSNYCDDSGNFSKHKEVVDKLKQRGIESRSSRESQSTKIPEKWRGLQGHQRIAYRKSHSHAELDKVNHRWLTKFNNVMSLVSDLTGWSMKTPSEIVGVATGRVQTPNPESIQPGHFDQYMKDKKIFSHAIKNRKQLRYTTDLEI